MKPSTYPTIRCGLLTFLLLTAYGSAVFAAESKQRPNVIYIMSDDHAAHAIGAYGSRLAKLDPTPVIDTLAKEGRQIKDTDANFPEIRAIVEEFWDYDEADRAKAIQLSHEYAQREKNRLRKK